MGLLDEFIAACPLLDSDRELLKTQRGFHDGLINKLMFRSCGPHMSQVLEQLNDNALIKAKILNATGQINHQLTRRNILIPYLDENEAVFKIRPHKYGFKGDGVHIYCPFLFDRTSEHLVITEGEFKAAAAHQYGYNVIAVPGISSFSKNHFEELLSSLAGSKVKKIIVLFDNEVKDNPVLPNYKRDWKQRYDTPIYNYIMANKLIKEGYAVTVAVLPSEWMVNGKIDLDGALAQGKSKDEIEKVLTSSLVPAEYFKSLKHEKSVMTYIRRRVDRFCYDAPVKRSNNCYWKVLEGDEYVKLSNFVIDITATYYSEDMTRLREVVITNEYGEKSSPTILKPEDMSSKDRFVQFCYSQGNYNFDGGGKDLAQIWQWEFMCDEGKTVIDLQHTGKVDHPLFKNHDAWIYGNGTLVDDQWLEPDENGVTWIGDKGLRVQPFASGDTCTLPTLSFEEIDLGEVYDHVYKVFGDKGNLLIGWAVFCLLDPYLKSENKITPFPFLYGEKASGKTTAGKVIMSMLGLPEAVSSTFTDISIAAITRMMGYYSSLPVFLDEFDNSLKTKSKEGHLKAAYNRKGVFKGQRATFGVVSHKIRSHMILCGETVPSSDALKSRCTLLHFALTKTDEAQKSYRWLMANISKLSYFSVHVLNNRKELAKKFGELYLKYYEGLHSTIDDLDERTVIHYALFAAGFVCLTGQNVEFNKWLGDQVIGQKTVLGGDLIDKFLEDLQTLQVNGLIKGGLHYKTKYGEERREIILWLKGVFDAWDKHFYNMRDNSMNEVVIREIMKHKDYCIDSSVRYRMGEKQRRVMILDYDKAPELLRDLVDEEEDFDPVANV